MSRVLAAALSLVAIALAAVVVASASAPVAEVVRSVTQAQELGYVPAGAPLGMIGTDPGDPTDPWSAAAPPGGVVLETPGPTASPGATGTIRIPVPKSVPIGPRRVGIQAGHWKTDEAPDELRRLIPQTGAAWEGITEVEINVDVAQRVAVILNGKGIAVDILPTTIPVGYVADAFVALHGDSDGAGERSGFKMAHGSRRGPHEDALLNAIRKSYEDATGLAYDAEHVTNQMRGYYPFSWSRFQHAVAAHTPAVILEMGYVSHDHDRALMLDQPDLLAGAIASGIVTFLDETPRSKIFGQDLIVPAFRRPLASPNSNP